jgi:hypothetical protein
MNPQDKPANPTPAASSQEARPPYEPPRITKRRSVSRATLFSGAGAAAEGVVTEGPPAQ